MSDPETLPWKISTGVLGAVNVVLVAFLLWIGGAVVSIDKRLAVMESRATAAAEVEADVRDLDRRVSVIEAAQKGAPR